MTGAWGVRLSRPESTQSKLELEPGPGAARGKSPSEPSSGSSVGSGEAAPAVAWHETRLAGVFTRDVTPGWRPQVRVGFVELGSCSGVHAGTFAGKPTAIARVVARSRIVRVEARTMAARLCLEADRTEAAKGRWNPYILRHNPQGRYGNNTQIVQTTAPSVSTIV